MTQADVRPILLVEDNPDDEKLCIRALKTNQVVNPLLVARDGQEALDILFGHGSNARRNPKDVPSLILLDLKLPKVDGFEILRRIRADETLHRLPVVILTSSKEDKDILNGYDLHANSYIVKPVDFAQFSEAMKQLKLYWLVLNQGPPA